MTVPFRIRGSGGGGGKGKGGSGSEAKNTLRSNARARLVELISEGEIVGLLDGAKSIYFDQTPVQNSDDSLNFKNVIFSEHKGLPDDAPFTGISDVETPVDVNVQVKNATGPVTRTIVDENATAARVIMRLPALVKQDKKSGSLKATSVSYKIEVRAYAGNWQTVVQKDIKNEKTTSPYQIAHRVDLPAGGSPWDVRVTRITADSDKVELQNDTYWDSYIILVEGKFIYPHSAAVALEVNAEDMGQSIPARAYRVKGLKINVPSNYDPETRTYTGNWDGTFKIAWTNNPAWVFYDLLVNDRYGLGEFINPVIVDKWSLYTIAQYCDQLVPSGFKNGDTGEDIYEPRFTFNGVINSRDDAYFVLQQISTAWRGMAFWSIGQVFASADMPSDPVKLVAPANVIDGNFEYSGTAIKARHSVCLVKWNDPDDFYRPATEVVIDEKALNKWGWRDKTLQLTGCTSRGLAHRYGKWVLDVEQNETETVEYAASWDHAELRPGNIIAIADPKKANIRLGGRIKSHVGNTIELDFPFVPVAGETYNLMLTMPDGTIETKPISSFTGTSTVNVSEAFSQTAVVDAMFAISGTEVVPRQYRVLSVTEDQPNIFKVQALFHDPNKYARVEQNITFNPLPYTRPKNIAAPPTDLAATETTYVLNGTRHSRILFSWSPNQYFVSKGFRVTIETPSDADLKYQLLESPSVELEDVEAGTYVLHVQTVALTGLVSDEVTFTYEAVGPTGIPMPTVSNVRLADRPDQATFVGKNVDVAWDNNFVASAVAGADDNTPSNLPSPFYSFNIVKVYDTATNKLLRTAQTTTNRFTYTYDMNLADTGKQAIANPSRSLRFEVTVTDIYSRTSDAATAVFTNPVPGAIAMSLVGSANFVGATWINQPDEDFAGVLIWMSDTSGFDPLTTTPAFDGKGSSAMIDAQEDKTYFLRIAGYDAFGKSGLTISGEYSVNTALAVDTDPPEKPTGLNLTTRLEEIDGIASRLVLVATIDPSAAADFAYFDYEIKQNAGNYIGVTSSLASHEWTVLPAVTYTVQVRAVDRLGNPSTFSDIKTIVTPAVPELAAIINGGSVNIDGGKITIQGETTLFDWRNPGDLTTINGNMLGTGTVSADKAVFGQRGINWDGIQFEHNSPSANYVSWTAGNISYIGDDGNVATQAITAGSAQWTTGKLYIIYVKGAVVLSTTTDVPTAYDPNAVILAVYRGDKDLNANYGRTVIDGAYLKAGTVIADGARFNSIDSDAIQAGAVDTVHLKAKAVKAGNVDVDNLAALSAVLGAVDIGDANIERLVVGTSNIQAGAVSALAVASQDTTLAANTNFGVTITRTAGTKAIITVHIEIATYSYTDSASTDILTANILRGATVLRTNNFSPSLIGLEAAYSGSVYYIKKFIYGGNNSFTFVDAANVSGAQSYYFNLNKAVQNIVIQVLELKR